MISMIAAVGKGNELGYNGGLIWRLPEDLKRFKEVTKGHTVLMGYKTFVSLPKLLPGRKHIVLTNNVDDVISEAAKKDCVVSPRPEVVPITELFEFIDKYKGADEELFIIGGGSVYKQVLPYADKLYLTEIAADFPEADVYFPEFDKSDFKKEVIGKGRNEKYDLSYSYVVYTRK